MINFDKIISSKILFSLGGVSTEIPTFIINALQLKLIEWKLYRLVISRILIKIKQNKEVKFKLFYLLLLLDYILIFLDRMTRKFNL